MSGPLYCRFCEAWFFCGRPCPTEARRDRCREYAMIVEAKRLNDSAAALSPSDVGGSPK